MTFCSPEEPLHVGWVKDHAIKTGTFVWKIPAIYSGSNVALQNFVLSFGHLFPEHSFSPSDISNPRSIRNMQGKNLRKQLRIPADMRRY